MSVLRDKAEAAGITVTVVDERGTSSTCPSCSRRVPKPAGRVFCCPYCGHCGHGGHRDLVAAANIAARGGGGPIPATERAGIAHRRAGRHLPGAGLSRRDPRRRPPSRPAPRGPLAGTGPPRTPPGVRGVARPTREEHARTSPRRTYEQMHLGPTYTGLVEQCLSTLEVAANGRQEAMWGACQCAQNAPFGTRPQNGASERQTAHIRRFYVRAIIRGRPRSVTGGVSSPARGTASQGRRRSATVRAECP